MRGSSLRTTYLTGERFVVSGTKGGAPTDPYWVRNVLADAVASVELADRVVAVRAVEITGPEADELYARQWSGARGSPSTSGRPAAGSR